jgi:hypothetical protein
MAFECRWDGREPTAKWLDSVGVEADDNLSRDYFHSFIE